MEMKKMEQLKQTADFLEEKLKSAPELLVVLGSGIQGFQDYLEDVVEIPYEKVPGFCVSSVKGHASKLAVGKYHDKTVGVMCGRFHYYEGITLDKIVLPIRAFRLLGTKNLLLTCAVGGICSDYQPGDVVAIRDHINLSGINVLHGSNYDQFGPRFPDLSQVYSEKWLTILQEGVKLAGGRLQTGVYGYMVGPSYETKAEVQALKRLGADMVGMSLVHEAVAAAHCGYQVGGLGYVSNMAAGISSQPITHQEVIENAGNANLIIAKAVAHLIDHL